MIGLLVLVPSRGRPQAVHAMGKAFGDTSTANTQVAFVIDDDDPEYDAYVAAVADNGFLLRHGPHTSMIEALNCGAAWGVDQAHHLMFMGDDHRPRTHRWDEHYLTALKDLGWGWVYGNDLLQGENLPTQFAVTSDTVRALGHMAPPQFRHLFMDNWVLALGRRLDRIRYLPDTVIEHLHPVAGKNAWDDGYTRVNSGEMWGHDQDVFDRYDFDADVRHLQELMPQ